MAQQRPSYRYDFPPASDTHPARGSGTSNPSASVFPENTARLDHLRNLLTSERRRDSEHSGRALALLDAELVYANAAGEALMSPSQYPRAQRLSEIPSSDEPSSPDPDVVSVSQSSSTSHLRPRRIGTRPSERLERHRQRWNQGLDPSILSRPHEGNYLAADDAMNPLSSMRYVPRIGSPDITTQEYSGEAHVNRENRWRAKRRKIDMDDTSHGHKKFNYGHRGQVVSGPLRMELVSCDGGQYQGNNSALSWPENVLRDDKSVYCTKSNRCNIVIRHENGIPFSLHKLVVKAPEIGYDAGVQEGMIFVSSDENDLLARTSQYQIKHLSRRERHRRSRADPRDLSRNEYSQIRLLPNHDYYGETRPPLLPIDRQAYLANPLSTLRSPQNSSITAMTSDFTYARPPSATRPQRVPDFHVSLRFDDIDSEHEDLPSHPPASRSAFSRHHRPRPLFGPVSDLSPGESDSSSNSDADADLDPDPDLDDPFINGIYTPGSPESPRSPDSNNSIQGRLLETLVRGAQSQHDDAARSGNWRSRRRLFGPSRVDVAPVPTSHVMDSNGGVAPGSGSGAGAGAGTGGQDGGGNRGKKVPAEVLAPHATFFIERDKSCVTIRFDPPVAGKFILVKLWSPSRNSNIDIQTILAHGFAGPRFFPSIEFQ